MQRAKKIGEPLLSMDAFPSLNVEEEMVSD